MPHATDNSMFTDIRDAVDVVGSAQPEGSTDEPQVVDNIESLCMNCHEQGITRLLLTRIPFFREVVLMSFECPHCYFKNAEIQSAGQIQERGVTYTLTVNSAEDLNRQVVKSETCTSRFPELELEIPAQRGQLTTIEGLLAVVRDDLAQDQPARRDAQPDAHAKIAEFIARLDDMLAGKSFPFSFQIDDPAGNSHIEPKLEDARGKWRRAEYPRTPEQNEALALTDTSGAETAAVVETAEDAAIVPDELYEFPSTCPSCVRPCKTTMKTVEIPHFTDVIIMATNCEDCGYKSNEVKTGGAVPTKGRIITLKVEDSEDLARDILKSETCALRCPEINLDLTPGTLGGRFTTLEGLLQQVYDDLHDRIFEEQSDSMEAETKRRWEAFFQGLRDAKEGKIQFTCILDDPLAASYVQNLCAPDPDPQLTVEDIERTDEQNEELGINDMKVEGYEEDAAAKEEAR